MRKKHQLSFLWIFGILLILMSRPKASSDRLQSAFVAALAPIWQLQAPSNHENAELLKLQIDNQQLKGEVNRMQELLKESFYLKKELQQLIASNDVHNSPSSELKLLLTKRLESVPAHVIYRAAASWNSFLWIDVGNATNEVLKRRIIAKNSPVVVGNSLVGVIDYVGKYQSRVRLITDSELFPAVRSVRGLPQAIRLVETINVLLDNLSEYDALFKDNDEKTVLFNQLEKLQMQLAKQRATEYLAKGELQGSAAPQYRSHGNRLKGVGFNYDYSDEKGPARDLRSGVAYKTEEAAIAQVPLLKIHDILTTSGMDGIFPEGLLVAEVVEIAPLEEGSYYYELEALPTAGNFDSLSLLFVMPPQGFDPDDQL